MCYNIVCSAQLSAFSTCLYSIDNWIPYCLTSQCRYTCTLRTRNHREFKITDYLYMMNLIRSHSAVALYAQGQFLGQSDVITYTVTLDRNISNKESFSGYWEVLQLTFMEFIKIGLFFFMSDVERALQLKNFICRKKNIIPLMKLKP